MNTEEEATLFSFSIEGVEQMNVEDMIDSLQRFEGDFFRGPDTYTSEDFGYLDELAAKE